MGIRKSIRLETREITAKNNINKFYKKNKRLVAKNNLETGKNNKRINQVH